VTWPPRCGTIVGVASTFVPGLQLAREFYVEVVRPVLRAEYPGLSYSAALIGWGSEVLGFDSERSTDHNWGPRLQVFLPDEAVPPGDEITAMLAERLPAEFRGYPTAFPLTEDPDADPHHRVQVVSLATWTEHQVGFGPSHEPELPDWRAIPTQRLAEITGGAVFDDGLGELEPLRARLAWYPQDVWLYVLACQWQRIAQEEAFPGRCGEAGDELGSAVVTGRLARDLMRLCLLMHRRYPPYSKWLGSAFAGLAEAAAMGPSLAGAIAATTYRDRETHLGDVYEATVALHNRLELTEPLDTAVRDYYDRPYKVLDAGRLSQALLERVIDPRVRALPLIGAVDQHIDNTDALGNHRLLSAWQAAGTR
jgi:hypothetical protein